MLVEEFSKRSIHNAKQVAESKECGCYFCLRVFPSEEILEFIDNGDTAICPFCNIDAILPNFTDKEALKKGLEYWFTGT
jgi:hypothetical protein